MNSNLKTRKAKAGLLLIASPRFKMLGEGLKRGTYAERKSADVEKMLGTLDFLDVVFPGIVYEKEEVRRPWIASTGEGRLRDCGVSLLVGGFRLDPLPA